MARSKRTDRAEARRRYRAALAAAAAAAGDAAADSDSGGEPPAHSNSPRSAGRSAARGSTQPRMGFLASLRLAMQPADVRADLRAFPEWIRSRAVWLPALLVIATGTLLLIPATSSNQVVQLAAQLVIVPPPMIPSFLAGMLATRAAYLAGGLVGLLSALAFTLYVATVIPTTGAAIAVQERTQAILYSLVVSPIFGMGIGAFAGFYRRFLRYAAPPRTSGGRPTPRGGGARRR